MCHKKSLLRSYGELKMCFLGLLYEDYMQPQLSHSETANQRGSPYRIIEPLGTYKVLIGNNP